VDVDVDDGYSENGRKKDDGDGDDDRESSTTDVEDSECSKGTETENEELEKRNTESPRRNDSVPTVDVADEGSEGEPDDDQMMAVDDQLVQMLKHRERGKKDKGSLSHLTNLLLLTRVTEGAQREATHFKNRVLDLFDIFVRRQPTSPYILQLVVPLLTLTFSGEKQLSDKAAGLLKSRVSKLKEVPSVVDVTKTAEILNNLHIRARRVHSRDALATINHCSLYVSRALIHAGADQMVRTTYTLSLEDFTERKASDLNVQFFGDFIKRYPRVAWGMRAVLLAAPVKAVNAYRRGQAYTLLETLLNSAPLLVSVTLHSIILLGVCR
jgi:DNA polymerase phi